MSELRVVVSEVVITMDEIRAKKRAMSNHETNQLKLNETNKDLELLTEPKSRFINEMRF